MLVAEQIQVMKRITLGSHQKKSPVTTRPSCPLGCHPNHPDNLPRKSQGSDGCTNTNTNLDQSQFLFHVRHDPRWLPSGGHHRQDLHHLHHEIKVSFNYIKFNTSTNLPRVLFPHQGLSSAYAVHQRKRLVLGDNCLTKHAIYTWLHS